MKIRVKTKTQNIKWVDVDRIQDYIATDGTQYAVAFKGDRQYKVIERDFDGAIFELVPNR